MGMRGEFDKRLRGWQPEEDKKEVDVDKLNQVFSNILKEVASSTLGERKAVNTNRIKGKHFVWDEELGEIIAQERAWFWELKNATGESREELRVIYKEAWKKRRKKVRKLEAEAEGALIRHLEKMRCKNVREFWQRLKSMARVDRKRDSLPEEMRDEKNQLVRGRDKLRVWTEAFRKLGSEENTNSFDPDHKDVVEGN